MGTFKTGAIGEGHERETKPAPTQDGGEPRFSEIRASDVSATPTLPTPPPPAGEAEPEVDVRATGAREIVLPTGEEQELDDEDIETFRPPPDLAVTAGAESGENPNEAATRRPGTDDLPTGDGDPTPLYVRLQSRALRPPRIPSEVRDASMRADDEPEAEEASAAAADQPTELDEREESAEPAQSEKGDESEASEAKDASAAAPPPRPIPSESRSEASPSAAPTVRPSGGELAPHPIAAAPSPLTPPTAPSKPAVWPRAALLLALVAVSVSFGVWLGSRGGDEPAAASEPVATPLPPATVGPALPVVAAPEPAKAAQDEATVRAQNDTADEAPADATGEPAAPERVEGAVTPAKSTPAVKPRRKPKGPTAEELAALPETPSRDAVLAAMNGIQAQASACTTEYKGTAQVDLTVDNTGRVVHVLVGGYFAGRPEGSCIARAVRRAKFPRFKQERFTIRYPLTL